MGCFDWQLDWIRVHSQTREETASMVFIGNRYREAWKNAIAQREQGDPREDHTGQKALREVIPSEARFTLPQ